MLPLETKQSGGKILLHLDLKCMFLNFKILLLFEKVKWSSSYKLRMSFLSIQQVQKIVSLL